METKSIKKTALHSRHIEAGAYMADFAGWHMPIYYSSVIAEHKAVREKAGVFDLSHMGVIEISGDGTLDFLQRLMTNNIERIKDNEAIYTLMCNAAGGCIDDLIVYRRAPENYTLIVNAANTDKDLDWIRHNAPCAIRITSLAGKVGLIGLQGPLTFEIMRERCGADFADMPYFSIRNYTCEGQNLTIARTGYTGEKGVEIIVPAEMTEMIWQKLTSHPDVSLIGLGARDSLRMEMGYSLYGHELGEDISPLEAGLGWCVDLGKEFIGCQSLKEQKERPARTIRGFELLQRGMVRAGATVFAHGKAIGTVTSGGFSPTLNKVIGMVLIQNSGLPLGEEIEIEARGGRRLPARLCGRVFCQSKVK